MRVGGWWHPIKEIKIFLMTFYVKKKKKLRGEKEYFMVGFQESN